MPYKNVTVFYGHIHQEHHHMTGHIAHHSAKSLIFPLIAPRSKPKARTRALGSGTALQRARFPRRRRRSTEGRYEITEYPVGKA